MDLNFPQLEEKILEKWKADKTFEKSISQRKKPFVFFEGPPTANGHPGIHHVLARTFKDVVCRYKTMRGFKVVRKAGWDTHGLPVELQIEKKLGLQNKKDIEKYGMAEFNKQCKESVWLYKEEWERLTERMGYWLDLKNPYITYENKYMESVWWIIKQIHQKGLLYQGHKVIPYCPRCGTALSSHEVAQGYKNVKENSIYIKFLIKGQTNIYLLAWTTTPWTLPANVALAIGKSIKYKKVRDKKSNEVYILAEKLIEKVLSFEDIEVVEDIKAGDLIGLEYEPLFSFSKLDKKAYFVVAGDFISTQEGTGIVHIAPAFGEDDMRVGKENDLPVILNVNEEGKFKEEVKPWAGKFVKGADSLIIEELKQRNVLFKEELHEHEYPFCWRCASPLIYYAKESWFVNMQKVKKDLIANNQKINWFPAHLKDGRFGEWLREVKDWAISRERYWGTPLPVWQCEKCGQQEIIGSQKELLDQCFSKNNYFVMRHGDSMRQKTGKTACWPEKTPCPLTEQGEREAEETAKTLKNKKINLIISSDLSRTKQTSQIVARATGAEVIFDSRLREFNVGEFNNKEPKEAWEYIEKNGNKLSTKVLGGESLVDLAQRVQDFLREINQQYQGKNILIISHELPISLMEGLCAGQTLKEILEWRRNFKEKRINTGKLRKLEFKNLPYDEQMEINFHRPFIDEVKFICPKCQSQMTRVPELLDVWFDSGSMPFSQYHWPFDQKSSKKPEQFPADYICEAIDQTRGWFYTLLSISTLLGFGAPYKNVISVGHVLDEKGEKMSKSKGNIVDPWQLFEKYGADAVRWYFYTINQPGEVKLFTEKDIDSTLKKFVLTLWNSFVFFETYGLKKKNQKSNNILDKWIISKFSELVANVTQQLDEYNITGAARAIESFTIEDLSQWYIRRSRRRFQKPENEKELAEASATLGFVLSGLAKLIAPFIPFLSEHINEQLGNQKSVHLEDWPKVAKPSINKELNLEMIKVREIVALALAERAKVGIKVRQPLSQLKIKQGELVKGLLELIKEEVNVKEVVFDSKMGKEIELDIKITPKLKEEGTIREVVRQIQEMRKKAGLQPKDRISILYEGNDNLKQIIDRNKEGILKETKAESFKSGSEEGGIETEINGEKLILKVSIIK
jgi:isoleucyl-tRNA synthetase